MEDGISADPPETTNGLRDFSRVRISKSDIQSFRQCPRKVWLEHHHPVAEPKPDSASRRRQLDGQAVGQQARALLDKPIWPRRLSDQETSSTVALAELTGQPNLAGVEVPLTTDDLYCRADALIPSPGGYILQETKASTFPLKKDKSTPAEPDEHLLDDVAIQLWAAQQLQVPIARAELNLINNQWCYPGDGDYRGLFRPYNVTATVAQRLSQIPLWIDDTRKTLAGLQPAATVGKQCTTPNACAYRDHCLAMEPSRPEHPIELLPDVAGKNLARTLKQTKGYTSILDPTPRELTGKESALYQRIQRAHRENQAMLEPGVRLLLESFPYPRYYFDFEGIDLPVPKWKGVRPYEQIPFQWSCHIESSPGHFQHADFLDLSGADPSIPCIVAMARTLGSHGPLFVYHAPYERGRLEELAARHPEHAPMLQNLIDRLVDLLPIVKNHFYHPAMQGSFSIKKVLPVVAPDLDYKSLEEVQEGTGAQLAYMEAALESATLPERRREIANRLKIYCRQDTWAMVELAYFLLGSPRPVFQPRETFMSDLSRLTCDVTRSYADALHWHPEDSIIHAPNRSYPHD